MIRGPGWIAVETRAEEEANLGEPNPKKGRILEPAPNLCQTFRWPCLPTPRRAAKRRRNPGWQSPWRRSAISVPTDPGDRGRETRRTWPTVLRPRPDRPRIGEFGRSWA